VQAITLDVMGESNLTSQVATAGAPVSPARISPPSPLDLLRGFGFLVMMSASGINLSRGFAFGAALAGVGVSVSSGKGSVSDMVQEWRSRVMGRGQDLIRYCRIERINVPITETKDRRKVELGFGMSPVCPVRRVLVNNQPYELEIRSDYRQNHDAAAIGHGAAAKGGFEKSSNGQGAYHADSTFISTIEPAVQ
jgi:hypothetical protein